MDEITQTISAIVPAYNESARIGPVLEVLASHPRIQEVIVIDDASTDNTGAIAQNYRVRYMRNEHNIGKGASMERGVAVSTSGILFFCDADIVGLTHETVNRIVEPVRNGTVDMFVAMRHRASYAYLKNRVTLIPLVGGERALQRTLWDSVPAYYKHRFRIEAALNFYAKYYGNGFQMAVFRELSQTIKEKKYGILHGLKQRVGMFVDIIATELKLQFVEIPVTVQSIRFTLMALAWDVGMFLLGVVVIFGTYFGPRAFIVQFFLEDAGEDPSQWFAPALLSLTNIIGVGGLFTLGAVFATGSLLAFVLNMRKLFRLLRAADTQLSTLVSKVKKED